MYAAIYLRTSTFGRHFGDDEAAAEKHFRDQGHKENRKQLSDAFLSSQRSKFARFKRTLPACEGDSFPISLGNTFHSLSDYQSGKSSLGVYSFWGGELDDNPEKLYADIGAGLRQIVWENCAYVEVYPSATTDILVEPNCKLPFKDASLDGIGCFAVLEHVNKPWEMALEFARVVKPGGKIFIDWPFLQPVHGYPSHYYNATAEGLRKLFAEEFDIDHLFTGPWQGPSFTVNWILNALLLNMKDEAAQASLSQMTIGELCKQDPQGEIWSKVLGTLDEDIMSTLSCGNTLVATRKPHQLSGNGATLPRQAPAHGNGVVRDARPREDDERYAALTASVAAFREMLASSDTRVYALQREADRRQAAGRVEMRDLRGEFTARDARLVAVEAAVAGARVESAVGLASLKAGLQTKADEIAAQLNAVRVDLDHTAAAGVSTALAVKSELQTTVDEIIAQLEPLRARIENANEAINAIKQATETWLLPTLVRHSAALERRGIWHRMIRAISPGRVATSEGKR